MMRLILCLAIFSVFISCAADDDVPKGIIPINQMKVIMYDVISAQELANLTNQRDTVALKKRTFELYQQVFAVHKIKRDYFLNSFHYYEENPDKIKILYDSLAAYADRKKRDSYMKLK